MLKVNCEFHFVSELLIFEYSDASVLSQITPLFTKKHPFLMFWSFYDFGIYHFRVAAANS
jgi:hypothetical protein